MCSDVPACCVMWRDQAYHIRRVLRCVALRWIRCLWCDVFRCVSCVCDVFYSDVSGFRDVMCPVVSVLLVVCCVQGCRSFFVMCRVPMCQVLSCDVFRVVSFCLWCDVFRVVRFCDVVCSLVSGFVMWCVHMRQMFVMWCVQMSRSFVVWCVQMGQVFVMCCHGFRWVICGDVMFSDESSSVVWCVQMCSDESSVVMWCVQVGLFLWCDGFCDGMCSDESGSLWCDVFR